MASCEMCGKEVPLAAYEIEGVRLQLCAGCGKMGTPLEPAAEAAQVRPRSALDPLGSPAPRASRRAGPALPAPDVLEGGPLELAEDYGRRIATARNAKGWSHEELGKVLNERKSIVAQLEGQTFRPSPQMIGKLERVLGVRLLEPVEGAAAPRRGHSGPMTLGDLVGRKRT